MSNTVEKPLENEGTEESESELKILVQKGQDMIAEAVARHPSGYKGRLKIKEKSELSLGDKGTKDSESSGFELAFTEEEKLVVQEAEKRYEDENSLESNGDLEDFFKDVQRHFQNVLEIFPNMKTLTLGSDGLILVSNIHAFLNELVEKIIEEIDSMQIFPFVLKYPDGGESLIGLPFDEIKSKIYMTHSDSEEEILSYKKLVKGTVNHEKGIILWDDGMETEIDSNKIKDTDTVVFAEVKESGKIKERNILPERNIMVGKINLLRGTIVFK